MKLKSKLIKFKTGGPYIAVLHKKDAKELDLFPKDRILVKYRNRKIIAVLDVAQDHNFRGGYIGLFEEVYSKLKVKNNSLVDIRVEDRPKSLEYIKKKLDGGFLKRGEVNQIIKDVINNELSEVELAYFISGIYTKGMNRKETYYLTKAVVDNGGKLKIKGRRIFDKHSIGGVPGNRTTMIVVPIVAAAGLTIPKTSSRSITSAAGTSDVVEVFAPVNLRVDKIKKVVKKTKACLAWGGAMDLASADDKLIRLERIVGIDPEAMLLTSILAKKAAVNANYVLIDIPYGAGAKIRTKNKAEELKRKFFTLGGMLGMKMGVVLTDGSQPIGEGIGPALEARDVVSVLKGGGPKDLRKKSIRLAGKMLRMAGHMFGERKARRLLDSGKAYDKFVEIIKAQGGRMRKSFPIGDKFKVIKAYKKGRINKIDNKLITKVARLAGSPEDKGAGVDLKVKKGMKVKKGDLLYTIYSHSSQRLKYACEVDKKKVVVIR